MRVLDPLDVLSKSLDVGRGAFDSLLVTCGDWCSFAELHVVSIDSKLRQVHDVHFAVKEHLA